MFLNLIVAILLPTTHAKYSKDVLIIPCQKVDLEIESCENKIINNSEAHEEFKIKAQATGQVSSENYVKIEYTGALVTGQIKNQKSIPCRKDQKIQVRKARPLNSQLNEFFINKASCSKLTKGSTTSAVKFNNFCDTPGDYQVESCFLKNLEKSLIVLFQEGSEEPKL